MTDTADGHGAAVDTSTLDQPRASRAAFPRRRVLMLLYHFPPVNAVPTPRHERNVHYLPRHGWTPIVVTPLETSEAVDAASVASIARGTRVIRTASIEPRHLHPMAQLARAVGRGARRSFGLARPRTRSVGREATTPGRLPEESRDPRPASTGRPALDQGAHPAGPSRILRFQRLLFFPDNQVGWLPFAVAAGMREHRARPVDVIYTSSAPYTAHLAGGILKRLTGRPWVAEFRDPWLGSPIALAISGPRPWLHRRLQTKVERWIVHTADRVVFVSPSTARMYRRRYPQAPAFAVVTNGHDPSDVVARDHERRAAGPFRIVYAGTLRPAELCTLLQGVTALVDRVPTIRHELEIQFYGAISDACRAVMEQEGVRLNGMLTLMGMVPRRAALEAVATADAALVMLGDDPGVGQIVPAKLFDCIGQSQQVLAVLPPGDARDILAELGWGVVIPPEAAEIECAIERLLTTPGPRGRVADPLGLYSRSRLAGRLAATLDAAAGVDDGGEVDWL